MSFYRKHGKRLFDLTLAVPALILLSPLLGLLALLVRCKLGKLVLFRQQRPGLHGKPFELVKFRTMTDARYADGNLLPDAERLPPFGRFLRASSLDELPQGRFGDPYTATHANSRQYVLLDKVIHSPLRDL